MRFEWDEQKNRRNLRKHGVLFEIAHEVFADPFCVTVEDVEVDTEQRFWTIGRLENLQVLLVVHTTEIQDSEEITRIISARGATPRERSFYEEAEH